MSKETNQITNDIPAGDIKFYDNYIPSLEAGNYFIEVDQVLTKDSAQINTDKISAQQEFIVSAPQYALDSTQIVNQYPPPGSTGRYGEVLPHIVLKDPMLAWERDMSDAKTPWLALMVFQDAELADGGSAGTRTFTTTVDKFRKIAAPVLAPKPPKEDDVDGTDSCRYIKMTTQLFQAIAPRLDELPYLSHVRQVNTGGRAIMGLNEHGLFSVTASNRFAFAPTGASAKPVKNIVHLVSLEGMHDYLKENADFSGYTHVALVSLASWTFLSLPDISQDFRALALNFWEQEKVYKSNRKYTIVPTKLLLRLPAPTKGTGTGMTEATGRIADGYAPLAYHTRSGEDTFAWYRGPLTPFPMKPLAKTQPFFTSDSAMIYDKTSGIFDVSLASAWEAGREAALSDSHFGQKLLDSRKKAHRLIDEMHHKLVSGHFTETQIEKLDNTTTVQDNFLTLLTPQLIKDIGATAENQGGVTIPHSKPSTADPVADAKAFLTRQDVQDKIKEMIKEDLAPVAEWLGRLMLLYPIPFDNLVPDDRMLPVESLRFFYIDPNWQDAALDGALSLGLDSSRQTFFSQVTKGLVHDAAMQALAVMRDKLEGKEVGNNPKPPSLMSGFLMRSAMVSAWPNLVVKAKDDDDKSLKILRMDHLSSSVLLCIFDGVPKNIEFSEPPESLGFGVDDDGNAVLRNITASGDLGKQIGTKKIRDLNEKNQLCMRSKTSNVLNIAPGKSNGLIQTLIAALKANGCNPPGGKLGPATFAIQMIKSPEAIVFSSQTKKNPIKS